MTDRKVVLVTGANQGLGFEIIHVTALKEPESIYILCSRDYQKGLDAREKLVGLGVKAKIEVLKLDVTNDADISAAVEYISSKLGHLDVLVNNAGISPIVKTPKDPTSPSDLREAYSYLINTNLISVYVLSKIFLPLIHKARDPKVINITSGLASMEFNLKSDFVRGMRSVEYGSSKVALNGVGVHMQAMENDRMGVDWKGESWKVEDGKGEEGEEGREGYVRFFAVQPGIIKTAFNGFREGAKSPMEGAEVAVRLIVDGQGGRHYLGGTYWKCDVDEMEEVPW